MPRGMADDDEDVLIGFASSTGEIAFLLSPGSRVLRWRPREYRPKAVFRHTGYAGRTFTGLRSVSKINIVIGQAARVLPETESSKPVGNLVHRRHQPGLGEEV